MNSNEFWCRAFLGAWHGSYTQGGIGSEHDANATYCEKAANAALSVAQRRGMVTADPANYNPAVCQAALDSIRREPDGDMRLAVELDYQASVEPRGPRRDVMRLASDRLRALARPAAAERDAAPVPTLERVEFTAERDGDLWTLHAWELGNAGIQVLSGRETYPMGKGVIARIKWDATSPPEPIELWLERA